MSQLLTTREWAYGRYAWARCSIILLGFILYSLYPVLAWTATNDAPGEVATESASDSSSSHVTEGDAPEPEGIEDSEFETVVRGNRASGAKLPRHRARSEVTKEDMERRLPRSAPDALRFEPGVFVQQTAHSQGSAFIRGMTGQQTLLLFDGIRLNNSTYRQGPNQYFFTLDSQSIQSIQVIRGGASSRFGSDALGGVILALPMEPDLRPQESGAAVTYEPLLRLRGTTADAEAGGRAQLGLTLNDNLAFIGGVGGRRVKQLRSGGVVLSPADGRVPLVPRFNEDGVTQQGTGFNEITADGRLLYQISPTQTLKLAGYMYRLFDGPRTDQCPAAYAPYDECLNYDEQFRTLVYGAWEGVSLGTYADTLRATVSWQRQRERRTLSRPSSNAANIGRDVVDTFGMNLVGKTQTFHPWPWLQLYMDYGLDTYHDILQSAAWISFSDINVTEQRSRGQYLDGSTYTYGGTFLDVSAFLWGKKLRIRGGGRLSWIFAQAPQDSDAESKVLNRSWFPVVFNSGIEWKVRHELAFLLNVDRSFRAPNLDDLTSRQQTGPGFQFENPALAPERATTVEVGARLVTPVLFELWAFRTALDGAVIKSPQEDTACPPNTPRCQASWTRLQLVNAATVSTIWGVEASALLELPLGVEARSTVAWTWGEGPNVAASPSDPALPYATRVPLSRIPPLNGTLELMWHPARSGFSLSSSVRWAILQDRLALADIDDERIPNGGTPGFAVVDVRANYRARKMFMVSLALENIFDSAYRYHGSSVNGPGRGLVLLVDFGPLWRL